MRIISGRYKGKVLLPPKNFKARPTTDFAKESLFNIIENKYDINELTALDLFSGTGAISFELASRGCVHVDCVEIEMSHYAYIAKMKKELDFQQIHVLRNDAFRFLKMCKQSYDLIFADPPYANTQLVQIPQLVFDKGLLKENGCLIIEHSDQNQFAHLDHFVEVRHYGSVNFSFFS